MSVGVRGEPLISFRSVTKAFGPTVAVDGVDLDVIGGRVLGVVGESGSGKTTCVRLALGLESPTDGELRYRGRPYPSRGRELRRLRRNVGFVFQDPYDSLDERMTIGEIVCEPLRIHGVARRDARLKAAELLDAVGLPDANLASPPREYSGGGRQRIAIARGLALDPDVLMCDEPTASLDASVQAQIVNLLLRLRAERRLAVMFVSHDLELVARIADEVVVMHAGRVVETGPTAAIHGAPRHPYTVRLLAALPGDHPRRRRLTGVGAEDLSARMEAGPG